MNRFRIYDLGFRNWIFILILTSYFLLLTSVPVVFAETNSNLTEYKLLEPLPGVVKPGTDKTDANTYLPGLFQLLLAIAGVLAVLRIIYGGFIKLSSDAWTDQNKAKEIINDALVGLLLTLGAWIIVNTIFNNSGTGVSLKLFIPAIETSSSTNPGPGPGGGGGDVTGLSHVDAMAQLKAAGIKFNGAPNLNGIKQKTVNEIIALKNTCRTCDVILNSATGGVHAVGQCSHANGYKFDLRPTETLNGHIISNFTKLPKRSDGADMYRAPSGALYARESSHWDVVVPCP